MKRASVSKCSGEAMGVCSELLPSFRGNGGVFCLAAHSVSSFVAESEAMALQSIAVDIEFTDRGPAAFGSGSAAEAVSARRERLHRRRGTVKWAESGCCFLNLPDLEPATSFVIGRRSLTDWSASSTECRSVHWVKVDDLRLDFFLCSFPQLLSTHHLVHCHRGCYEWIQTDSQCIDIVHRFMAEHDASTKDIALSFQIRPRSDTKSDAESMENHKQFLLDRLLQIDRLRKDGAKKQPRPRPMPMAMEREDDGLFFVHSRSGSEGDGDIDIDIDHRYAAIYNDDSQHLLMEDVIAAIHQNEDQHGDDDDDSNKEAVPSPSGRGRAHSVDSAVDAMH